MKNYKKLIVVTRRIINVYSVVYYFQIYEYINNINNIKCVCVYMQVCVFMNNNYN